MRVEARSTRSSVRSSSSWPCSVTNSMPCSATRRRSRLRFLALVGGEALQEVVEVAIARVVPLEVAVAPQQPARLLGRPRARPHRGTSRAPRRRARVGLRAHPREQRARAAARAGRSGAAQQPRPGGRRKGHGADAAWGSRAGRAARRRAPRRSRTRTRPRSAPCDRAAAAAARPCASDSARCCGVQPVRALAQPVCSSAARNSCRRNG